MSKNKSVYVLASVMMLSVNNRADAVIKYLKGIESLGRFDVTWVREAVKPRKLKPVFDSLKKTPSSSYIYLKNDGLSVHAADELTHYSQLYRNISQAKRDFKKTVQYGNNKIDHISAYSLDTEVFAVSKKLFDLKKLEDNGFFKK